MTNFLLCFDNLKQSEVVLGAAMSQPSVHLFLHALKFSLFTVAHPVLSEMSNHLLLQQSASILG